MKKTVCVKTIVTESAQFHRASVLDGSIERKAVIVITAPQLERNSNLLQIAYAVDSLCAIFGLLQKFSSCFGCSLFLSFFVRFGQTLLLGCGFFMHLIFFLHFLPRLLPSRLFHAKPPDRKAHRDDKRYRCENRNRFFLSSE